MTTTTGGSEDAPQENGSRSGSPVRMQYSTPISPSANYGTTSSPQQQLQASMTYNSLPVQYGYIMSGLSPQQQQQLQQQLILQSSPPRHASPEHNNNTMMNSNNYNNDNNSSISSPVSQNYVAFVDHQQRPPPIQPFQYNVHSPQAPASGTFIGVDSHQQPLSNSQRLHVVNGVARTSLDSYRSSAHESAPTQNNVNNNEGIPMN